MISYTEVKKSSSNNNNQCSYFSNNYVEQGASYLQFEEEKRRGIDEIFHSYDKIEETVHG